MFSLAKVRFVKIAILFTSLILCLLPPREHRRNSDSTPCQQKVLFVNICHLHWLSSARGYPREFPSVPFRSLQYIWYCRPIWLSCVRGSARENSCNCFVFVYCPEYIRIFFVFPSVPFRSLWYIRYCRSSLLAVLLCGVPETLVAFWGTLRGYPRE